MSGPCYCCQEDFPGSQLTAMVGSDGQLRRACRACAVLVLIGRVDRLERRTVWLTWTLAWSVLCFCLLGMWQLWLTL